MIGRAMRLFQWKSKMARRLVRMFTLMVAAPILVTMTLMAYVGRSQTNRTLRAVERINSRGVEAAGRTFQDLGARAVHQSGEEAQNVTMQTIQSLTDRMTVQEASALRGASHDLVDLAQSNFDTALQQSMATNDAALGSVQKSMGIIFAHGAGNLQTRTSGNIEKAMLALDDTLMQERATRLALVVSEHISDASNFLNIAALMPAMSGSDKSDQKATLDALVRRFPQFKVLAVLNRQGDDTAMSAEDHAVAPAELGNHANAVYFKTAIQDHPYLALEAQSNVDGVPCLRIAVPIELYRGRAIGVLTATLSLEDLWDTIRAARIGHAGFAYILDERGRALLPPHQVTGGVLTCSAPVTALHGTAEAPPWQVVVAIPRTEAIAPIASLNHDIAQNSSAAMTSLRTEVLRAATVASSRLRGDAQAIRKATSARVVERSREISDGLSIRTRNQMRRELTTMQSAIQQRTHDTENRSDRTMTVAAIATSRHMVEETRPLTNREVDRTAKSMSLLGSIILMLSCIAGGLLAMLLAGKIVRPITHLAEVTKAIAAGDLERRVEESAPDEIGDLAAAFNTMAESLQASRNELQAAEGQLVQSAKLASLGTLSAGVAHELNQPIAIIRGIAQQLQDEPGLSDNIAPDLVLIVGQTARMVKIVKHLRTFCRTSNSDRTAVDVNQTVRDCFLLVGEQLRTHDIEVRLDLSESPLRVVADANELEQVFLNLITNARDAIEHTPGACIRITSELEEGRSVLRFHDNGTGIPEEIIGRVFDPFFTTKDPGKGTGLGLSISHSIIEKHGGEFTVCNDGGACFTISLPAAESGDAALPEAA